MGSLYLAHTIRDANWTALACRQGCKAFFEICQTAWILIHRCGSPVIVRSLTGKTISRLPVTPPPMSRLKCGKTKEPYPESNLVISYFPCHGCICMGLVSLISLGTQPFLITLFYLLLGSSRGQNQYCSSPVPLRHHRLLLLVLFCIRTPSRHLGPTIISLPGLSR